MKNVLLLAVMMLICSIIAVTMYQGSPGAAPQNLSERLERVVFGDVFEAYINDFQVYAEWDHRSRYGYERLEDEIGEVICYLRGNENNTLPYRLMIRIDVRDSAGNVSSVPGMLGVFSPEVYNQLNCNDGNYTLYDLEAIAEEWDTHPLVD